MYTVCLDAGHGVNTPGKRDFNETFFEYEFNRDVALKIKYHLERHNVNVILTAPTNEDVPLSTRCKIANNLKADIFISIHANAYGLDWNNANGWEIYYNTGSEKGLKLAQAIHSESIPFLGINDRGIKNGDWHVIKYTKMPATLIEHFFFTNKSELLKCNTQDFREKCAIADTKGILKYLGIEWQDEVKKIYKVQVGVFSNKKNALALQDELMNKGYQAVIKEEQV